MSLIWLPYQAHIDDLDMGLISSPYGAHISLSAHEGDIIALGAGHACHIKPLVWIYGDDIEAPPCVYKGDIGAPFAAQTRKMRGKGGGGGKPGLEWASPQGLFQMDARAPPTFNLDAHACRAHSIRPTAPLTNMLMHKHGILKT